MLFKDVVGQAELKSRFIHEINQDKVSHAQLFLGDTGHGSFALALAYVQYLMCENRQENDACGVCSTCKKNNQLIHPDVHFFFPVVQSVSKTSEPLLKEWREQVLDTPYFSENNWVTKIDVKHRNAIIGTEDSKDLLKKTTLKTYEGGYRVLIIWKAESMNITFANKILKTLEEPTPNTLVLLVAEDSNSLLTTVLSRTQLKKIPKIAFDETVNYLVTEKGMSSQNAQSYASRMDCSLSRILENVKGDNHSELYRELFMEMMRSCYKKNALEMLDWAEKASVLFREEQIEFLEYCLHMIRQSIVKNYTGDQLFQVSKEEADFLVNFAKFITGNNVVPFMTTFSDGVYHIERNANSKILFTNLSFQVMRYIHYA